ncbi:MAG: hypothetical protein NW200_01935 [Hyphomonadaceae bacterium]|nr:hypothetical protein [Hyphomonadaceae bacterium]
MSMTPPTLGGLAAEGADLLIVCQAPHCATRTTVATAFFAARFGERYRAAGLADRLHCAACGGPVRIEPVRTGIDAGHGTKDAGNLTGPSDPHSAA